MSKRCRIDNTEAQSGGFGRAGVRLANGVVPLRFAGGLLQVVSPLLH